MGAIIAVNLNLSKLDKAKIVQGKKGSYYPLTLFVNDDTDQFGNNVAVATGLTKEEREAGAKTDYVANGKVVSTDGAVSVAVRQDQPASQPQPATQDIDLPF